MKDNQKYLLIGVFIIFSVTVLVSVWLWFSSSNRQVYDTYLAVFHEPIDGVTTSSVVKYNGVEIGKVKQIELDKQNPNNIRVYINVLQGTPITTITYAVMKSQGITGMSYIDLRLNDASVKYQIITPTEVPPYPEIQTKSSLLFSLSEQAQSVTDNVKDISVQAKLLLDNKNINHVANIVANLDTISQSIASRSKQISKSIDILNDVLNSVKSNSQQVSQLMQNASTLTQNLNKTTNNLNTMLTTMQNTTLQNVNSTLLPNMNQTIENMNRASIQLEELLKMLNQNPSSLVRGRTSPMKGPGE